MFFARCLLGFSLSGFPGSCGLLTSGLRGGMSRFLDLQAHLVQASGVLLKVIIANQTRATKRIQLLFHIIQSAIGSDNRINAVDQRGQCRPLGIDICRGTVHAVLERTHLCPGTGQRCLISGIFGRNLLNRIPRLRGGGSSILFCLCLATCSVGHLILSLGGAVEFL